MNDQAHTVTVAKDLEDLIPTFMKNRTKELETLRAALSGGDMEQLRQLGHRMKGVGNSYGFEKVSTLGKQIEDGAKSSDRAGLEAAIAQYADYLARVKIVYE
ncbi:MAG TPA: Hpt domain-containing protein [Burkholderiales bacterium]|jgi:HPt (histidine-containing phosphotransfer) domain-containing protein|nr:Hpt domain-containing protein [Burkholderiales bacterium]HEX2650912.1 Hpt domain-containing protein [Burkholderiales bacterium]